MSTNTASADWRVWPCLSWWKTKEGEWERRWGKTRTKDEAPQVSWERETQNLGKGWGGGAWEPQPSGPPCAGLFIHALHSTDQETGAPRGKGLTLDHKAKLKKKKKVKLKLELTVSGFTGQMFLKGKDDSHRLRGKRTHRRELMLSASIYWAPTVCHPLPCGLENRDEQDTVPGPKASTGQWVK